MAVILDRRTTPPSYTNKYYIKTTKGGYNKCVEINASTGSVLPNCVGYAYGRFMESQGVTTCRLSRGNAENWYGKTSDGYERGRDPKLGAIICWSDSNGDGHVAFVEKVYDTGDVLTSNSAYNGSRFYMKTLKKVGNYYMGRTYHFQGFIYNPTEFIDPDEPPSRPPKSGKFKWVLYARKLRKRDLTV